MNVELLQQVKAKILEYPEHFHMGTFFRSDHDYACASEIPNLCGTTACIAGWAMALQYPNERIDWLDDSIRSDSYDSFKFMGLTDAQCEELFYAEDWDDPFEQLYYDAETKQEEAEVAANYIDYFIAKYSQEDTLK